MRIITPRTRDAYPDIYTRYRPRLLRVPPSRRRDIVTNAQNLETEKQGEVRSAKDVKAGFKWDPAMSRWRRVDRLAGTVDQPVVVQPKSGPAYTIWPVMHWDLTEFGLESVPPQKAQMMQREGWTIIDVRVEQNFNQEHILNSVSIPLFRRVQGTTIYDYAKRIAMGLFAMTATERDPDFAKNVIDRFGQDAKLLLACDIGGTLKTQVVVELTKKTCNDPERAFGRESRSLKAAHALLEAGCKNIVHLEGGIQQWRHEGHPMAN